MGRRGCSREPVINHGPNTVPPKKGRKRPWVELGFSSIRGFVSSVVDTLQSNEPLFFHSANCPLELSTQAATTRMHHSSEVAAFFLVLANVLAAGRSSVDDSIVLTRIAP